MNAKTIAVALFVLLLTFVFDPTRADRSDRAMAQGSWESVYAGESGARVDGDRTGSKSGSRYSYRRMKSSGKKTAKKSAASSRPNSEPSAESRQSVAGQIMGRALPLAAGVLGLAGLGLLLHALLSRVVKSQNHAAHRAAAAGLSAAGAGQRRRSASHAGISQHLARSELSRSQSLPDKHVRAAKPKSKQLRRAA